jgi:hypothetical protein
MATFHILTQYIWPDGGSDGIYAEQLAEALQQRGCDVRLVGGTGTYRPSGRKKPGVPLLHLQHYVGRRGNLGQTFVQYCAVARAFDRYIRKSVYDGDVVIASSAPPTSVHLAKSIKRRGARAIYWLQDYYPELVRGIREYPQPLRTAFCSYWDRQLLQWDRVVKIGANLRAPSANSIVIRNWPTLDLDHSVRPEPRTALYSGNLGYGHDIALLIAACEELRAQDYQITVRADGRGVRLLPSWLKAQPLHPDPDQFKADFLRHEVHLIAAHPKIRQAIFPCKIWNSLAAGRRLVCTGFAGEMLEELETSKTAAFKSHLDLWTEFAIGCAAESKPSSSKALEPSTSTRELQPAIG